MDKTPTKTTLPSVIRFSRIPSPTKFPSPKHYTVRQEDQNKLLRTKSDLTNSLLTDSLCGSFTTPSMSSEDLITHTKRSQANKNASSKLDDFYSQRVQQLNVLREELQNKESVLTDLQAQRDALSTQLETELTEKVNAMKSCVADKREARETQEQKLLSMEEGFEERLSLLQDTFKLEQDKLKSDHWAAKNSLKTTYTAQRDKLTKECEDRERHLLKVIDDLSQENHDYQNQLDSQDDFLSKESEIVLRNTGLIKTQTEKHSERVINLNLENSRILSECEQKEARFETLLPIEEELDQHISELESKLALLQKAILSKTNANIELLEKYNALELECQNLDDSAAQLQADIAEVTTAITRIDQTLKEEEVKRRVIHNELQDLRGNIRVFCRLRPVADPMFSMNISTSTSAVGQDVLEVRETTQRAAVSNSISANPLFVKNEDFLLFKFDKVFDEQRNNYEVFDEVSQLVQSSLDGYNVCIFAYGQTGSGKTYTMLNPEDGIIPLTLKHIYQWIEKLKVHGWKYKIFVEFVEIYNETIMDLLNPKKSPDAKKIEIRHIGSKTTLTNVDKLEITDRAQMESLLKRAMKTRSTASTNANNHSSRSHSIFTITLQGTNATTHETREGVLNLIDLAGSERLNSSLVSGDRLKETQAINKSLSCLGDVIHSLKNAKDKDSHIPFRNSKLTYLLQNYLIGDGKTLMFVNISGNSYNETLNSLRFASKVNSTKMKRKNL